MKTGSDFSGNFSAITIDVEDGVNILMKDHFNVSMPPTERVVINVDILLNILAKYSTRATFFILGEVADAFPELVKRIDKAGHEIGVHGYNHDQLYKLTPEKAANDILRAKDVLENMIGKLVSGYRAPAFSVFPGTSWALKVIAESGFKYDSSIMPVKMKRYGWDGFEKDIVRLDFPDSTSLIEVPLPVINLFGIERPVCGGGYLRYFPLSFTLWAFSSIIKYRPVVVYLHPYELDTTRYPDYFYRARKAESIKKMLPLMMYRFKKETVQGKLDAILNKFEFTTLGDIIEHRERENAIREIESGKYLRH